MHYYFNKPQVVVPSRTKLVLPQFTHSVVWLGVSELLARYPLLNTERKLSIALPVRPPNSTFLLAISWTENDVPYRYKFWDGGSLHFPIYDGQRIGLNAYLEVWSIDDVTAATADEFILYTSWMNEVLDDGMGKEDFIPDIEQLLVSEAFVEVPAGDPENPFDFPIFV